MSGTTRGELKDAKAVREDDGADPSSIFDLAEPFNSSKSSRRGILLSKLVFDPF